MSGSIMARCYTPACHTASVLITLLLIVPGYYPATSARASPQKQILRPLSEGNVSPQVPGQFALQLRHDKPLLVEGRILDREGKSLAGAHVVVIAHFPVPIGPSPWGRRQ
jgi:hypothetical protein